MNENTIAGPAPGRAASPTIAVPVVAKMPAPIVAPTPSAVRCHFPSVRLRPPCEATSASKSATDFLAKSWLMSLASDRDAGAALDSHTVERAVHEEQCDHEEHPREHVAQHRTALLGERHCQLDGEQSEERRELDDRIERDRRRILERVTNGVADDRRRVERRAFLLQLHLDDLLGVVPRAAGVGHEDGLIQSEQRDRDEIADEEVRLVERERERG